MRDDEGVSSGSAERKETCARDVTLGLGIRAAGSKDAYMYYKI